MSIAENVFWIIENIFAMYIINGMFRIVSEKSIGRKTMILRICAYTIFYAAEMAVALGPFFSGLTIFSIDTAGCILVAFTYKCSNRLKILIVAIVLLCNVVSDGAVTLICLLFHISHYNLINITIFNLILAAFGTLIECTLKLQDKAKVKINVVELLSVIIISMIGLFLVIIVLDSNYKISEIVIGGVCLILIHLFLILSIKQIEKSYKYELESVLAEKEKEIYRNQIRIIIESEERTRNLRHDMKNHLAVISKLAESGERSRVTEYIDSLINSDESGMQFSNTGNAILDGIINVKLGEAKRENVNLEIKINVPSDMEIAPKDIVIVLGNLLDNSIRGACECKDSKFIRLYMCMDRGKLFIEIENSYNGILDESNGKLYSTKSRKTCHGIGLNSVMEVVKRYDGDIEFEYDDEQFRVRIIMFPKVQKN